MFENRASGWIKSKEDDKELKKKAEIECIVLENKKKFPLDEITVYEITIDEIKTEMKNIYDSLSDEEDKEEYDNFMESIRNRSYRGR